MADTALYLAQDPASDRLSAEDVMEIHRLHVQGNGWDQIAAKFGTNRKNVQRIVQGRRWRNLHPAIRPDLYDDSEPTSVVTYTEEQIDVAFRAAYREFLAALER
jgi:hypothetical protein